MIMSDLRSAPRRKTASATLPSHDGKASLSLFELQSTAAIEALLPSITAYSPVSASALLSQTCLGQLTNQDRMASVVVVKEVEFSDKVVGSGVLVVVERDVVRDGVNSRSRRNDGDVRVHCLDGAGEHGETVCRITGITTTKVVFVTDLFRPSATRKKRDKAGKAETKLTST
jgi:hypothetical protein